VPLFQQTEKHFAVLFTERKREMLELIRNPSRSASGAILYVTVGTLMVIWAGLYYYFFLFSTPDSEPWQKYGCVGTILSGLAIAIIGFLYGQIGQGAKSADNTVGVASTTQVAPLMPVVASSVNPVDADRVGISQTFIDTSQVHPIAR
jgi:hypothetical protein